MKLVSFHIHKVILLFILIGFQTAQAQVWTLQQCIDTAQVKNLNLQNLQSNPNFILILKILSIILLFFIFIIFPINRLQRSKTIFLESQNKIKEITKQEKIFKNKLNFKYIFQ